MTQALQRHQLPLFFNLQQQAVTAVTRPLVAKEAKMIEQSMLIV